MKKFYYTTKGFGVFYLEIRIHKHQTWGDYVIPYGEVDNLFDTKKAARQFYLDFLRC